MINKDKIKEFILCTKKHFENKDYNDSDLNLFLDFDLSSFRSEKDEYVEINKGIEFEFMHHLTPEKLSKGRKMFLESVLKKKNIFRTKNFEKYENKARENIQYEIDNF